MLDSVHVQLDRFWKSAGSKSGSLLTNRWQLEFTTAMSEICGNVVKHAFAEYPQPGTIEIRLKLYENRVEAEIIDDGADFHEEPHSEDPVLDSEADIPEGGRGLQVARAMLDSVVYRRSQESKNHWLLVKHLR